MWKTPDLRVRPTGSASGGPEQPRYGQLAAWPVVPSLTPPLFYEYYFLPSCVRLLLSLWSAFERVWVLALSVTGSVRLSGLREGLTRGLLVMERLTVRGYRVTRSRARGGGVIKRKERPRVRAHRFGLGQLLRARVRPMAGDSPSGERLAGQSGLVFHIARVSN